MTKIQQRRFHYQELRNREISKIQDIQRIENRNKDKFNSKSTTFPRRSTLPEEKNCTDSINVTRMHATIKESNKKKVQSR